jgi:hypothetical protein
LTRSEVRSWMFKGLSVENVLDSIEAEGVNVRASSDPRALQRVIPLEDFSVRIRRSAMQAFPAYLAFFCLENSVRELVAERMSENHGSEWWTSGLVGKKIVEKVAARQLKEGDQRWHVRRGEHELYYTDFGDLSSIIQSNWADFEDLFPDQNWVTARLDELEKSRNIIAHSNVLDDRELQRLSLYLDDWTRQVG